MTSIYNINIFYTKIPTILTIFSYSLLTYALLSLNPSTGYEISIYAATPAILWIAITFSLINGIFLIAFSIFNTNKIFWLFGSFQIVFCNIIVTSLYALRGYVLYFGRGDAVSYVGMAKDIITYNSLPDHNFYPITSLIISQMSQLLSLPVIDISKYLPSLFLLLYTLFVYCWAKAIINDSIYPKIVFMASTPIFFAWFATSIYHQYLSVMILPLFFLCLQKNKDFRYRILCIILCVIYPFWHPITAIIVCLYLTIWFLAERQMHNLSEKIKNVSFILILISIICLTAWFINQYLLLKSAKSIILQLINLVKIPSTAYLAEHYLTKIGLISAVKSLFLMISDDITLSLLSIVSVYYIMRQNNLLKEKLIPIFACFIVGNIFLLIIFFAAHIHTPDRLINLNFNMIFTPLLAGWLLYMILLEKKKSLYILLLFFIFVSSGTSIASLYPSPITMRPNDQVTLKDVKGMSWLISKKDYGIKTADVMSPVFRFADLIYGYSYRLERKDLYRDLTIPDHFGFKDSNHFSVDRDRYLTITELDIRSYTEAWKNIDRFRNEDFIRVEMHSNVSKIYENGELRNYLIKKI